MFSKPDNANTNFKRGSQFNPSEVCLILSLNDKDYNSPEEVNLLRKRGQTNTASYLPNNYFKMFNAKGLFTLGD